ncbi:hypothetical protein JCM3765_004404 [Sporobolomyces pararoseus]
MQIRLPRPKDQEPRRKRPPIVSTADNPICAICNRQISRYHCPTCNLPYCSLACYKSPQHEDCSEKFDRQSLLDEIKSAEGKSSEEKKAMLDMLKRFEEENAELEEGEQDEARDLERQELEKRLEGVDLDSLPPDELLSFLSPSQQAAFTSTLSDPDQINKLVAQELETEQPWWIEEDEEEDDVNEEESNPASRSSRRPALVDESKLPTIPLGEDLKPKTNQTLIYNVVAVLLAYSYTLRTFALASFSSLPTTSSERIPATQLLAQLVPFMVERSNTTLSSLDGAVEYIASREESILSNPVLVALLLHDLSSLLEPLAVTEEPSDPESSLANHPRVNLIRALSDLYHLFAAVTAPPPPSSIPTKPSLIARPSGAPTITKVQRSQATMASHKLLFFASFVSHSSSPVESRLLSSISHRAERSANMRELEVQKREEFSRQAKEDHSSKFLIGEPVGVSVDIDKGEAGKRENKITEIE